jgi:hypothetical protein
MAYAFMPGHCTRLFYALALVHHLLFAHLAKSTTATQIAEFAGNLHTGE